MLSRTVRQQSKQFVCALQAQSPVRCMSQKAKLESEITDYYDKASHYRQIWGDSIHIGYYKRVNDPSAPICAWDEAQADLTSRMGKMIGLDATKNVLDLGCGFGQPATDNAKEFGCRVTGVDISPNNIDICRQRLASEESASIRDLCRFEVGSFLNLEGAIAENGPYTSAYSIEAVYHVAPHLDEVLSQLSSVLEKGGLFANCDFLRADSGPTEKMRAHFYERLKMDYLNSTTEMMEKLCAHGFAVEAFEDWSDHCVIGYNILMERAQEQGDEVLATHYRETKRGFAEREILMPLIVARKL